MVEHFGGTVEHSWWNTMVEQCNETKVEQCGRTVEQ